MDTPHDFDAFYEEKIVPSLPRLKKECKDADNWAIGAMVVCLSGTLLFILISAKIISLSGGFVWVAIFSALVAMCLYMYVKRKNEFTKDFKELLIKEVIHYVNPGLVYQPNKWVPSVEFKASSLYRYKYDYYGGDDLVEGAIDGVAFRCSELLVECDSEGRNRQLIIFHGLFLVAAISNRFSGGTYIWPKKGAELAGNIMAEHRRLMPMPKVSTIKSGEEEFDHYFSVATNDKVQAHEILSPDRRARLLNICKAIHLPVSVSFVAGRCYVGVPTKNELMELNEIEPGRKEEIKNYFIIISLIQQLVRKLDLVALS